VAALSQYTNIYRIAEINHAVELASVFFGLMFIGAGAYSVDKS